MLSDDFKEGILTLEKYGFVTTGKQGIVIKADFGKQVMVQKSEYEITITYDTKPHFYMALARSVVMKDGTHRIEPKIKQLGIMLDCSRNAVAKPDMLKRLICLLVLMGYNYLQLYMEDTYELPDEPYFGYKRGRYSAEELKEVVAFADKFDFEMMPCIQTLAHLKTLANWSVYYEYMDIEDILLVNDDRTYALIRKCIQFCKEVFHTKRINIGTDEAFHLGRGKYIERYGYRSKHDIYLDHLKKVFEICREEDAEPEFWADAFYNTECPNEEVQAIFDGTQTPIYWDYYSTDIKWHDEQMHKLKEYAGKVIYGGGLWKWMGYAPDNAYSDRVTDSAFEAAEKNDVDNILMTAWGDDGDECSIYAVIPSMWHAAQKLYPCDVDKNRLIKLLTGYTDEEWRMTDLLNRVMPDCQKRNNAAKYLLHNDFLIGLLDYHIPDHAGEFYRELLPRFEQLAKRESQFAYIFKTYAALCRVLIRKATYSKRLYSAYQEKDYKTMRALLDELQDIKRDLEEFFKIYRDYWFVENKGFGFETMDVRIGSLIVRIETVTAVLNDYLDGRTERVYELEEERIDYWCGALKGGEIYAPHHECWATAYSVNHIFLKLGIS